MLSNIKSNTVRVCWGKPWGKYILDAIVKNRTALIRNKMSPFSAPTTLQCRFALISNTRSDLAWHLVVPYAHVPTDRGRFHLMEMSPLFWCTLVWWMRASERRQSNVSRRSGAGQWFQSSPAPDSIRISWSKAAHIANCLLFFAYTLVIFKQGVLLSRSSWLLLPAPSVRRLATVISL